MEGSEVAGSLEVADAQGQNGALTQSRRRSGLTDVAECEDADASEANEAGAQEQEQRVEADEVSVVDASRG